MKDKGNAADCFSVNAVPGLSKAAIPCKHSTSNGIFKCYNCGGQVHEASNKWKSAMQLEGKSWMVEGIEEEGITLIFDNTLQAPKEVSEEEGRVSRGYLVLLSINSFQDCVLYDNKTMNVCHLLLASGRPCQHDRQTIHGRTCKWKAMST